MVERLTESLRTGKVSREMLTDVYADDVRLMMLFPHDPRYGKRQAVRLEAIRLSGVEPLPRVLAVRGDKPSLVLDMSEPRMATALDKARVEWAAKGYRVEESAMPFGWTRIDVSTRGRNPGGGKQPWEMTLAEAKEDIRETGTRLIQEANRTGKPIDWTGYWHGYGGRGWLTEPHKRAVRAAIEAGLPVPPEVLADYPELKGIRRNPGNDPFAWTAPVGGPDMYADRPVLHPGDPVDIWSGYAWRSGGVVKDVFEVSDSASVEFPPSGRQRKSRLGFYKLYAIRPTGTVGAATRNPIDLAAIVGVGVLAGAVQGVVEPYVTQYVTRHVYEVRRP
jgi:hypothetical protein